jgi:hypothetical protein
MRWDQGDAGRPQSDSLTMAGVVKRFRRVCARAAIRPAGQRETANLLASFGMISGLLLFWAMAVAM